MSQPSLFDHVPAAQGPTGKTVIISNGSKFAGQKPDSVETLFRRLQKYTLEPSLAPHAARAQGPHLDTYFMPDGTLHARGNFREVSAGFSILTSNADLADTLTKLIAANLATPEYRRIWREYVADCGCVKCRPVRPVECTCRREQG